MLTPLFDLLDLRVRWWAEWQRAVLLGETPPPVAAPPPALDSAVPEVATLLDADAALSAAASAAPPLAAEPDRIAPVKDRFEALMVAWRRAAEACHAAESGTDRLTGLGSRNRMMEAVEREAAQRDRYGRSFCVALGDIDHFKRVNDTHGHAAGDRVLAMVGAAIRDTVRAGDEAFRYGGEEFLVVLKNADLAAGIHVTERLRQAVARHPVTLDDGTAVEVTISFGIAVARPGEAAAAVVAAADRALYAAKAAGRNRVVPA
jgi:diguanylate cyclase (GGDEF)-like protein